MVPFLAPAFGAAPSSLHEPSGFVSGPLTSLVVILLLYGVRIEFKAWSGHIGPSGSHHGGTWVSK